jgi:hypothetical protein
MIRPFLKATITTFCFLIICSNSNATSLNEALQNALNNNSDIKLEKSRLGQVKATKGDAISEFLPDINATYQRGRQKNDAVGIDRGDLDKINDQDVKQLNFTCIVPLNNGTNYCKINQGSLKNSSGFKIQYRYINKEDLWFKFYMHAPRPRLLLEKKFKTLRRASVY